MFPPRAPVEWVATPPPGPPAPEARRRQVPYTGPPSYLTPPRWSFPVLAWRWPTSVAGIDVESESIERVHSRARLAMSALWLLAVVAVLTSGAEVWRYVLLLGGRTNTLPRDTVELSDTLVVTGSVLSIAAGALALTLVLWWLLPTRRAAAEAAGYEPARSDWQLLPGLFVPGLNLVVPGAMLAELEHAILVKPAAERPKPSALLRSWWIVLVGNGVLFAATVLWRFRDTAQAHADGVLLSAATNLAAGVLAVLTVLVIARLSSLLAPTDPAEIRLMRVVRVDGAPEPPLRATRPAGAVR
ncbi:MAG: DUF4328 domain-containing protein [Actinomycetota bacterium]|nr:DUF4328 domain-containing protein [Actinomycetota bacterium]